VVNIAREDITEQSSVKEFFTTKASPIKVIIMYPKLAVQKRKKKICGHGDVKQVM
jgi:hypothetical protein